jgi:hypothetical protein
LSKAACWRADGQRYAVVQGCGALSEEAQKADSALCIVCDDGAFLLMLLVMFGFGPGAVDQGLSGGCWQFMKKLEIARL